MKFTPNETVTMTLENYHQLLNSEPSKDKEIQELKLDIESMDHILRHNKTMLERIEEVAEFDDFAQYQSYKDAYKAKMNEIKQILEGGR